MMRYLAFILLLTSFVFSPVMAQSDGLSPDEISAISQSVVYIEAIAGRDIFTGSGTIVTPTGRIYTNRHVIEGAEDFHIYLQGDVGEPPEMRYMASLDEAFNDIDFAILQIDRDASGRPIDVETLDLPYLDNFVDEVSLGDRVFIFGYPSIGDGYLVLTQGSITSVENATIFGERIPLWYRTDAEISPGNSGGLAVNASGEFIAIPTEVRKEERTLGRLGGLLPYRAIELIIANVDENTPVVERAELEIVNTSSVELCFVYISPITSTSWGQDRLGNEETIPPESNREFELEQGTYDIQLKDCDGEELFDGRGYELTLDDLTLVYSGEQLAPQIAENTDNGTQNDFGARPDMSVEILDIEHNYVLEGYSDETGMYITTYMRVTGYRDQDVRVQLRFFWEDGTPIPAVSAVPEDRTPDNELMLQTILNPDYDDTEYVEFWFWMPYSSFPPMLPDDYDGYVQAYIGLDSDDVLYNPSNTFDYVIYYE